MLPPLNLELAPTIRLRGPEELPRLPTASKPFEWGLLARVNGGKAEVA